MKKQKGATAAQLQADIQQGRTGSKVRVYDPAAAPLGTDEEAAGSRIGSAEVESARRAENLPIPSTDPDRSNKYPAWSGVVMWLAAVALLVLAVTTALLLTAP